MSRSVCIALCVFFLFLAMPCIAAENFKVTYRCEIQPSSGNTQEGYVLINVFNGSGQEIRNLDVWAPEAANPVYPAVPVPVGDLGSGYQAEVLKPFTLPKELLIPTDGEKAVTWRIEFTNAAGEREVVDVIGKKGI